MKYLLIIFLTIVNFTSNAQDIQIIELHKKKSLDELKIEQNEENFDEVFLKLNKLLLKYNLPEVCDYQAAINYKDFPDKVYGYAKLKVQIFCLILEMKNDEANLLNSFLIENGDWDMFFQDLYEELMYQRNKVPIGLKHARYNRELLPLYAAMIRIGQIPAWSNDFLKYDELLIPVMLVSINKELRIKAARYAYRSGLLTKKKSESCIEAIEKGIKLFTAEGDCLKLPFENQKQNNESIKPFDKPEF